MFDILDGQSMFGNVPNISVRSIVVVPNDLEELHQLLHAELSFPIITLYCDKAIRCNTARSADAS
jgi:hypothetical protein